MNSGSDLFREIMALPEHELAAINRKLQGARDTSAAGGHYETHTVNGKEERVYVSVEASPVRPAKLTA